MDYRFTDNQSLFGRFNIQDDTINGAPQFEGQVPATQNLANNFGFAIGHDYALSSSLVNSFRYGMTAIDTSTVGRQVGDYTTFRFLSNYEPITFNSARETPTHNIVNDLSWLKGSHTFKVGTNLRWTRIPELAREPVLQHRGRKPVVGRRRRGHLPAGTLHLHDAWLQPGARGGRFLQCRLRGRLAELPGCAVAVHRASELRPRGKPAATWYRGYAGVWRG